MTTVASVFLLCITVVVLSERYYRFKQSMRIKETPLNVKELDDIREEISKLKGRISASKIGKAMEL